MKLLNSKNLKVRNKTFDWTSRLRKPTKAKFVVLKSETQTQKNMWGLLVQ